MSVTRLYVVQDGDNERLIEATSAASAIRHAALDRYTANIAKPKTIADLMANGVRVEQAKPDQLTLGAQP